MDIKDYSPYLALSAQAEIIKNQRVSLEYWRGQVAGLQSRIRDLEVALETVLDTYDNITTHNFSIGLDMDIRNEARKILQKGQQ